MNCELGPGSLNLGGQFTERAFSVHRIGFTEYAVVQLLLTHAEVVFQMVQLEVIVACKGFDPDLDRIWRLYSFTCDCTSRTQFFRAVSRWASIKVFLEEVMVWSFG